MLTINDVAKRRLKILEILARPYPRTLLPTSDGWHGEIKQFPGCFACGNTAEETARQLEENAWGWVSATLDQGGEIPPRDTAFLNSELATIDDLLESLPEHDTLGRESLKARREEVEKELPATPQT